jgi:hypothetical protein
MNTASTNSIPVYQSLNQTEVVTNQTSRPDLIYSRLTTFDLILRRVKKEGIGIIFSHHSETTRTAKKILSDKEVIVAKKDSLDWSLQKLSPHVKLIVIEISNGTPVKISDIEVLAKTIHPAGLKWISILFHPGKTQLFRWDLKYNFN